MQNKSHLALKARLSKCNSLEDVITLSRRVTNPFLNPNHDEKTNANDTSKDALAQTDEPVKEKRPQPQRWESHCVNE